MSKGANRIYEWGISAIDDMYHAMHRCDHIAGAYSSSSAETAKLSLAWIGRSDLVMKMQEYSSHAYHAFYNLRVYEYPTQ